MSPAVMYRDGTARTCPQTLCIASGLMVNGCENLCARNCPQLLFISIGLIVKGCERLCVRTCPQLLFIRVHTVIGPLLIGSLSKLGGSCPIKAWWIENDGRDPHISVEDVVAAFRMLNRKTRRHRSGLSPYALELTFISQPIAVVSWLRRSTKL